MVKARLTVRRDTQSVAAGVRLSSRTYLVLLCSIPIESILFNLFFKDFIYLLFLDRGEGREKKWERNINVCSPLTYPLLGTWPATHACALTGNRTGDPLVHKLAFSPLSLTSQGPI